MASLAIEVPLAHFDPANVPSHDVPPIGPPLFEFEALPEGEARAGRSALGPSASSTRCLVWRLEGGAPEQLLLQEAAVNEDRPGGAVRLAFAAPLLPAVSCVEAGPQGSTHVAVVTADGGLHTFQHSGASTAPSLARELRAPGAVTTVPLGPLFQRAGAPTAILEVGGWVCVGTADGNVVCLPHGAADAGAAVTLAPTSGLTKVLGGLFGRPGGLAVRQLAELRHMNQRLLAAIHEGGQLRLWDLDTRRLVHSADLLPHTMAGSWVPSLARLAAEPLDASTFILLVYFEHSGACAEEGGSPEPGMLATYEIFLEQRGEGAYKVLVELGPRLQSGIHHLQDLALEPVALHTVGAWLLYDDAHGARHLHCIPLSFTDGAVHAATEVQLLEEQLVAVCQPGAGASTSLEALQAAEAQLGAALSAPRLAASFADAILAPGRLSRPALAAALARLGCTVPREEVLQADVAELKQQLPRWVAAAAMTAGASAAVSSSAGTAAAALHRWTAVLQAYSATWHELHLPVALLQLPSAGDDVQPLLLARRSGMVTTLRSAVASELALREALPTEWQAMPAEDVQRAAAVLEAAAAVGAATGGAHLGRLLWACIQEGQDAGAVVLPALVRSLAAGGIIAAVGRSSGGARPGFPGAGAAVGSSAAATAHAQWRAACRRLPLQLSRLCSGVADGEGGGFAAAVAAAVRLLDSGFVHATRHRSELPSPSHPIRSAALASLAQVAWAQLQVAAQLALLMQHLLWSPTLANWSLSADDRQQLERHLLPDALELLRAAAVAYWAAVTPVAGTSLAGAKPAPLDPSQLVVSLHIGDVSAAGSRAPPKHADASPDQRDAYVAALLLASAAAAHHVHVVRNLADLQRVSLLFAQRLLCLQPSVQPANTATAQRSPETAGPASAAAGTPDAAADVAVEVCMLLFRGRHTAQLAALQHLLPADCQDMRLLFFRACSRARQILLAASPEEQQQLEEQSCSLFFRAAAVFSPAGAATFPGQAAAVSRCVQQMLADQDVPTGDGSSAQEQQYYEALVTMYQRMGRHTAAARCALAAALQAGAMAPAAGEHAAQAAQGRLWANVFSCMMEAERYEEAYMAVLSIEAAELQVDCLHRLVAGLCSGTDPRAFQLLCRLPFAQNMLLMRGGRQAWVPMLEVVVDTLQRRAVQLDLRAAPQPYKVLADFHTARSNYQAAAGAMLAYARRLVAECPDQPAMLADARHALAAAVSCLSLVDQQHAWVEDPAAAEQLVAEEDLVGSTHDSPPPVLTLAALQREYAIVRGRAALAAALPGEAAARVSLGAGGSGGFAEQLAGGDAEDVFAQLLAMGLHDDAFQLAEAAFVGSQLARGLERAFAGLAAACVQRQLAGGAASLGAASLGDAQAPPGDGMDIGEAAAPQSAAVSGAPAAFAGQQRGAEGPAAADWQRLKDWLIRHEASADARSYRLVILDAVLCAEPRLMLPPWLMDAFRPAAQAGSLPAGLAGALRLLMKHGRLADAATLASQHLQAALESVPIGMARMSKACFPAALLDQLLGQLAAAGAAVAAERQRLADLLQRVRGAAMAQTAVVQQLYAQE